MANARVVNRLTVDMSESAAEEIARMRQSTGRSTADLVRMGMSLLRIAVNAKDDGRELHVVDPTGVEQVVVVNVFAD